MGASESDHATGIARWRSAVQAQASATLPLTVRDRTLGALTLEWPELHEFDDAEREMLAALAAAVAIGVDSLGQQQIREDAAAVPAIVRRSSAMLVSPDGAVGPAAAGTPAVPGATRVWVDAALPRADLQRAPFWDVVACEGRRVAIVAGAAGVAAGGADARAASARHMLRGWLVRGIDPGDALCSLAAWAAAEQPGASWLTVSVAVIDQTHRLCVAASAGPSVITFVGVDGRARTIRSSAPLLGGDEPYVAQESTRLLLPGDRVALWSGECAAAEEREGAAGPAAGLRREVPGAEAAAGLLGRTITTGPCCETAAVLEVL
jgi:hypothetical protein